MYSSSGTALYRIRLAPPSSWINRQAVPNTAVHLTPLKRIVGNVRQSIHHFSLHNVTLHEFLKDRLDIVRAGGFGLTVHQDGLPIAFGGIIVLVLFKQAISGC
jgi:hypothetical protein